MWRVSIINMSGKTKKSYCPTHLIKHLIAKGTKGKLIETKTKLPWHTLGSSCVPNPITKSTDRRTGTDPSYLLSRLLTKSRLPILRSLAQVDKGVYHFSAWCGIDCRVILAIVPELDLLPCGIVVPARWSSRYWSKSWRPWCCDSIICEENYFGWEQPSGGNLENRTEHLDGALLQRIGLVSGGRWIAQVVYREVRKMQLVRTNRSSTVDSWT